MPSRTILRLPDARRETMERVLILTADAGEELEVGYREFGQFTVLIEIDGAIIADEGDFFLPDVDIDRGDEIEAVG